jgi:hypothetical protein
MITAFPLHVAIVFLSLSIASEEPSLDELLGGARSGDWRALAAMGHRDWTPGEARKIIGELGPLIEHDNDQTLGILSVIGRIRSKHPTEALAALPALVRLLDHPTRRRGDLEAVIRTVGQFGDDAKSAVPSLRKLPDGFDNEGLRTYFRIWATAALAKIEPRDEKWAKWLAGRVRLGTNFERTFTVQALAYVGPPAKSALPDLRNALKDGSPSIRTLAAGALWSIGKETASTIPILIDALSQKEEYNLDPWGPSPHTMPVSAYACAVLGAMGSRAKEAIPALRKAQQSGDDELASSAEQALQRITRATKEAASSDQPQGRAGGKLPKS